MISSHPVLQVGEDVRKRATIPIQSTGERHGSTKPTVAPDASLVLYSRYRRAEHGTLDYRLWVPPRLP